MKAGTHPHFDDGGAVAWQTDLGEALRSAARENKLLFVEYGREQCSQCRTLVEKTLKKPALSELLAKHYVALAADCDAGDEDVDELAMKLEGAEMLPFVLVCDSRGQFLDGLSGRISPESLQRLLERLSERAPKR
jgi:thioredoxin-related protein